MDENKLYNIAMKNIYVCGPTVYSKAHIGNLRPIITFDIFRRSVEFLGEEVNLIHNITDIDDKIIEAAKTEGISEKEIASKYKKYYLDLLNQSNVITPSSMPEVVNNIKEIITFIEKLIKLNKAYEVKGSVYFDVSSIESYGKLSNREVEEKDIENADKKHSADFALWKATDEAINFDSPWGMGRPGWHTECSAFINKELKGNSLDIHGGGIDLLFPHHENENAQYLAVNNKEITKEWKHTGKLNIKGVKMSKSIGNVIDAQDFINEYGVDMLRMIFLTTSYSSPIDIADEMLESNKKMLAAFKNDFIQAQMVTDKISKSEVLEEVAKSINNWKFASGIKLINIAAKKSRNSKDIKSASNILGIMKLIGFAFAEEMLSNKDKEEINKWEELRKNKDFEAADKLREKLAKEGKI